MKNCRADETNGPGNPKANIKHRTSNIELRTLHAAQRQSVKFDVRRSMFDVRCSPCGVLRSLAQAGACLLAAGFLSGTDAPAQTTNPPAPISLEEINREMTKAESVFTRFVQERHVSLFEEPLRSEGYLCFQKPGRVRWEITRPYRSILVSDGSGVAQFEWTDEHWKKLDLGLADALQNVVAQIAGVMEGRYTSDRRSYAASATNSAEGPVITLVPQNETMHKVMAAIEVHLAPDLKATRRVVLRETGGDYTDIRFSDQIVGLVLPPRTFDRNAPADLEQIRAAAERK